MSENIGQAINEVMRAVGYVKQTGSMQVQGHRYSYTSESDLIEALRPAMNEAGVICMPRSIVEIRQETYTTKGGSVMNRVTLLVQYAFVHSASETELLCQTVGEGSDAGDKATAKAMTGALKYALRQTFLIETGDDPDKVASVEQERAERPQKARSGANGADTPNKPPAPQEAAHVMPGREPEKPYYAHRPHNPEVVRAFFKAAEKEAKVEEPYEPMDNDARQALFLKVEKVLPVVATRKRFQLWGFGVDSIADMTNGQGWAYLQWAKDVAMAKRELDDIMASASWAGLPEDAAATG